MLSPCSLCSARCCKELYITVTAFDVLRIAARIGKEPSEFAEIYPLKLINFDNETVLECYDNTAYPAEYILCIKSHPCFFLKDNKCTIHEFSPCVCRSFPKGIDGSWKTRVCPFPAGWLFRIFGTNTPSYYVRELTVYKNIVMEWNKKKGKKEDCMIFLLEKARRCVEC